MGNKPSAVEEIIEEERVPAVRPSVGVALWLNKFIVNTRNQRRKSLEANKQKELEEKRREDLRTSAVQRKVQHKVVPQEENSARANLMKTRMNRQAAVLQDPKSWSSLRYF